MKFSLPHILFTCLFLGVQPALAFKLLPMSRVFTPSGSGATQSYEIVNDAKDPLAVEMSVVKRKMDITGTESYSDGDDDFLIYPPQILLKAGEKQTVRVTWVGDSKPTSELAYRLIAQQVPIELQPNQNNQTRPVVFVNNRLVNTLQLPAGKQDIRNLPLAVGANDVQLLITDNVGRVSRLNFSTALAVVPHHNLGDQIIGINPAINGYTARIDSLGSGIVPNLQPYNVSHIKIDSSNLPLGYNLGKEYYAVLPSYKSGTLIRVGTDATVFLKGKLLSVDGKAVALQSGKVISLSDSNWQTLTLFTNKAGKFALPGLKPGRYEMRLLGDLQQVVRVDIPANQAGLYDIGTLTISTQTTSN